MQYFCHFPVVLSCTLPVNVYWKMRTKNFLSPLWVLDIMRNLQWWMSWTCSNSRLMTIVSTLLQLYANKNWIKDTVRLYTLYANKHITFKYERVASWLLDGFVQVSLWIGSGVMFSVQTKRALYLTKTPFQVKCKLHDNLMTLYMRVWRERF